MGRWIGRPGIQWEDQYCQDMKRMRKCCHLRSRALREDGKAAMGRDKIRKETLDLISYEKGILATHGRMNWKRGQARLDHGWPDVSPRQRNGDKGDNAERDCLK